MKGVPDWGLPTVGGPDRDDIIRIGSLARGSCRALVKSWRCAQRHDLEADDGIAGAQDEVLGARIKDAELKMARKTGVNLKAVRDHEAKLCQLRHAAHSANIVDRKSDPFPGADLDSLAYLEFEALIVRDIDFLAVGSRDPVVKREIDRSRLDVDLINGSMEMI